MSVEEEILEFRKYLKKLENVISTDAIFSFLDLKLYDKKRIDDIICCIEGSWPVDYKKYITKNGTSKLKTPVYYKLLTEAIRKFLFSTSCYSVNYKMALANIKLLQQSIVQDVNYILKEQ